MQPRVRLGDLFSAPRLRFELHLVGQPVLSVKILKSSLLKCSRFREYSGIWCWTGRMHPNPVHKRVLKMGDLERGVSSRLTLKSTRKTAVEAYKRQKRKTTTEIVFRFIVGSPEGIRTLDLMAENHASWTTRRRGHVSRYPHIIPTPSERVKRLPARRTTRRRHQDHLVFPCKKTPIRRTPFRAFSLS